MHQIYQSEEEISYTENNDRYRRLSDDRRVKVFIQSVLHFLDKFKFDGIDVDWEFPKTSADKIGFSNLLKALKQHLKPRGYLLTTAVSAYRPTIDQGKVSIDY